MGYGGENRKKRGRDGDKSGLREKGEEGSEGWEWRGRVGKKRGGEGKRVGRENVSPTF